VTLWTLPGIAGLLLGSEHPWSQALARGLPEGPAAILAASGGLPLWAVALIAVYSADFMTEVMSNTATANLLIPIFLALSAGATLGGCDPLLPALAATLGCSLAFCIPVATPPNAIVYGSGQVPLTQMIRSGILLDLGCGLLAWAGLLLLWH
jgi:sodium-dependent dicarboxylate transporter 2/3/5